jgi:oligopeptidase B
MLAYGVDTVSRRRYTIYFLDLETGNLLPDKIDNTTGQVVWAEDNKTLFYTSKDFKTLRADKINSHKLGSDLSNDRMVYYEADETFSVYLGKTKSRKYIIIQSRQTLYYRSQANKCIKT